MRQFVHLNRGIISVLCATATLSASANWEQFTSLPNTYAHYITSEGVHLISDLRDDMNGGISYSEDNGQTWVKTEVRDYWYNNFYEADGYIFAIGNSCRIARSEDGGRSWDVLNYTKAVEDYIPAKALEATSCYGIATLDGVLYAADFSGGGVLKSEDYGETWEITDRESQLIKVSDMEPLIDNYYNLIAFNGKIYSFGMYSVHSFDPKTGLWTAEPVNSNFMSSITIMDGKMICGRSVMNFDEATPYLIYFDGQQWGELPNHPNTETFDNNVRAIMNDGGVLFTAHHGGPLYYTENMGEEWKIIEGLPSYTYPLTLHADKDYIYTALYSPILTETKSGVWRFPKNALNLSGIKTTATDKEIVITNSILTIGETAKNIDIFNVSGEKILSAQNAESIDISALTPGMYIFNINYGNNTSAGKFIKATSL